MDHLPKWPNNLNNHLEVYEDDYSVDILDLLCG